MFVCNESSILNLIGIVYLKVINVRLNFTSKKSYFLSMFAQKGPGARDREENPIPNTDTEDRSPTPTPTPINWVIRAVPNNCTETS